MQNFLSLMAENTFAIIIAVMGFFGCLAYGIAGKGMSVLYNESLSMTASSHQSEKICSHHDRNAPLCDRDV